MPVEEIKFRDLNAVNKNVLGLNNLDGRCPRPPPVGVIIEALLVRPRIFCLSAGSCDEISYPGKSERQRPLFSLCQYVVTRLLERSYARYDWTSSPVNGYILRYRRILYSTFPMTYRICCTS